MKPLTCIVTLLLFSLKSLCQFTDTYQPAAVYKQNHVKARVLMYNRARFKARIMSDRFDTSGFLTEHIDYDTLGERYLFRETLVYDSSGKITSHTAYKFTHFDTANKTYIFNESPDTILVIDEYDSLKRLVKQTGFHKDGKRDVVSVFGYEPMKKAQSFFLHDTLVRETIFYYDKPFIENKIIETFYRKDGGSTTHTISFKNSFDKQGKVVKRKRREETDDEKYPTLIYFKEMEYQYAATGLLIYKLSSGRSDGTDWLSGLLFDYKFW